MNQSTVGRKFANELLNQLEDLEMPLLMWGVTEGALSEDDVLNCIEQFLDECDNPPALSAVEILREMQGRALLFKVPWPSDGSIRYRTRFAEALRLTAGLRQLFRPRGDWADDTPNGWWRQGKRLVADYRLHVRYRRYPDRDIPGSQALKELRTLPGWGDLQDRVAQDQLGGKNLARFQLEATQAVFSSFQGQNRSKGIIVSAGTGSGKTLSFYLPAFAAIAEHATNRVQNRIHTLALYPRTELLRDQLRDAIVNARSVQSALVSQGKRPLRLGALYGGTPNHADDWRLQPGRGSGRWARVGDGAVCPFLPCPSPECEDGELIWSDRDRAERVERLICRRCGDEIPDGQLALTRESLKKNPPHLLFTTTEMLNNCSADGYLDILLGWRGGSVPSLMLLDEVHTYSGVHGAQVAYLLRRWRDAVGKPVTFVGLSATLRDANQFFAQLVGLRESDVDPIAPDDATMVREGREYALALRGDPVSGASLLSTSIQTAMLWGRVLDNGDDAFLYGSTGFLFTDALDVTNRFYKYLRDAEGDQDYRGRTSRRGDVLAGLRSRARPEPGPRYLEGQNWELVERVGHELDPDLRMHPLIIGRTSSQDAGVNRNANLTIATASLEVGFNDPRVGLVLQHKAPRNAASFIQRRGRAGRERGTRPLTIVTLSDYGRDRLAYQGYETLFAPEVAATTLPLKNRYVLKIQGAQALLDWAGRRMRVQVGRGDVRKLLTTPDDPRILSEYENERLGLIKILHQLLTEERVQDEFARHLVKALKISVDEAQAVLWEQPRSLLMAVVPTALRRLRSRWEPLVNDPGMGKKAMLPEFITRTLFEPLNLPEVDLELPFDNGDGSIEHMPIGKALTEAVPGRVSRRFGYLDDTHRTWLPIPDEDGHVLNLREIVTEGRLEGTWQPHGHDGANFEVVRPLSLALSQPDPDIVDQSHGQPQWGTQIVVEDDAPLSEGTVSKPSPWQRRIDTVSFATHAAGNPVQVRRMTFGAECNVRRERQNSQARTVRYELRGRPAALGFALGVDAIRFELKPLNLDDPAVREYLTTPQWRSLAFLHTVQDDPALAEISDSFQRERLAQIYLTAFALAGLDGNRTNADVRALLKNGSWTHDLSKIFQVLYRDSDVTEQEVDGDRLVSELIKLVANSTVITALDRAAELLVAEDISAETSPLARRTYRDTMAAAILAAAQRACPNAQDGDLIVDTLPGEGGDSLTEVWLSETSVGGLGIVEQLVDFYSKDPRQFWGLVTSSLAPSEYEYVDATLTRFLRHVIDEPSGTAAQAMATLRAGSSAKEAEDALDVLREAWARLDGPPRHAAVAALSTRLLRPGSGPDTDVTALVLVDAWTELEQRLRVEVDARVIAYAVGSGKLQLEGARSLTADQVFSLLWPRGHQARTQDLKHYQPYADDPVLERLLVQAAHDDRVPVIDVTKPTWGNAYRQQLTATSAVELVCPAGDATLMAQALKQVPITPIDRDVLRVYGEICGVVRHQNEIRVRVELREAAQ
ncbi:DEAD/DEAH box helicase [Streptomyces somaliensis DSM 40738]|uniref:protein DpdJ n=1 Tax=Streptomyces somaliensis TaxID=78355 RepID=UPI0021C36220|nr:protein DpdJ [Streptomyces somaliensis]MCQ0022615.1 DEAD/DEAH box helicase [Streptomyces somaliensis DSM 40738]